MRRDFRLNNQLSYFLLLILNVANCINLLLHRHRNLKFLSNLLLNNGCDREYGCGHGDRGHDGHDYERDDDGRDYDHDDGDDDRENGYVYANCFIPFCEGFIFDLFN